MTIKEMKNRMNELHNLNFNKGTYEQRKKLNELKIELLKESGYTTKYNGRLYLQESAKKEQVALYYDCFMIAYDIVYC